MLAVVLCLVFTGSAASGEATNDYDSLLAEAVRARSEGRLEDSLSLLRRAHDLQRSAGLRNNIARVLEELGRWREAVDEYRSVVSDPTADAELKALDDQRIAELAPKLLSAWITFDVTPESAVVLLDGQPVAAQGGKDQKAAAGTCIVESRLEREILLEAIKAPAGTRTTVKRDLLAPQKNEARVAVDRVQGSIDGVAIDRYRLRSPIDQVHTIRLRAGTHTIELDLKGAATASIAVTLAPSQTFDLSALVKTAAPLSADEGAVWPYFAAGGGVAAAALGGVLFALAESDRREVRDAIENARGGVIYDLTRERAEEIESGARTKSAVGVVLIGAGASAIAGALIGWALD